MRMKGWRTPLLRAVGAVVLGTAGVSFAQQSPAAKAPVGAPAAAAPAADRDWTDDWRQPTSWFKWGADERIRQEYVHNPFFFDTDPPGNE